MKAGYDPLDPPRSRAWRSMDEDECIEAVLAFHRILGIETGNDHLHATVHVIVENQALLGEETPVRAALVRLVREGLDRHEAIHAVGSALIEYITNPGKAGGKEVYFHEVETMTAEKWWSMAD